MPIQMLMPDTFQGSHAKSPYFEGWYFRLQNDAHTISLIPGMCLEPEPHAYLQILFADTGYSLYREYPISSFCFREDRFAVSVGSNQFSTEAIQIDEPELRGNVTFSNRVPFSTHRLNTGMMGPFAFLPAMQCQHGVVTIRCALSGCLETENGPMDFTGGIGYVEKDWGSAFPQPYLWTQGHFQDATFMLCLASVPVPGCSMTGLLAFLYTGGQRFFFSTYKGAHLSTLCRTEDGSWHLGIRTPRHRLFLRLYSEGGLPLRAPGTHGMNRVILEDPNTDLTIRLTDLRGNTLYQGRCSDAGSEIVGNLLSLT